MFKVNKALVVLGLLLLTSVSIKVNANNKSKTTENSNYKLKLVANYWEPYTGDGLDNKGIACSFVISNLKKAGIDAEILVLPWTRAYKMVQEGKADGIVAIWHTEERSKYVHFSDSYLQNNIALLKRKETRIEYRDLSSIEGMAIGLGRGYDYHSSLLKYEQFNKVYFTRVEHAIEMLHRGRIDAVLTDKKIAQFHIQNSATKGLSNDLDFVPTTIFKLPLYFGMSKKYKHSKEIIEKFNLAMASAD